jgi:integrase
LHEERRAARRPDNRAVYEVVIALEPDPERRHGRVFPAGNDRRGSQLRTAFEATLARAGISGFRFHDLRHTAASHLRMTNRYAHLSPAHLRGAVERLAGLTPALERTASAHDSAQSGRIEPIVSRADA